MKPELFFFLLIIAVKSKHNFEEYSFSQTTLEQVFVRFAKEQEMEDTEDSEETRILATSKV